MAGILICPHCQAPNPDDSQYCDQCSVPLKARPPGAALGPAGATLPAASVPPASARALGLGATSIPATVSVQPSSTPGVSVPDSASLPPPAAGPAGGEGVPTVRLSPASAPAGAAPATARPAGRGGGSLALVGATAAALLVFVAVGLGAFVVGSNVPPTATVAPTVDLNATIAAVVGMQSTRAAAQLAATLTALPSGAGSEAARATALAQATAQAGAANTAATVTQMALAAQQSATAGRSSDAAAAASATAGAGAMATQTAQGAATQAAQGAAEATLIADTKLTQQAGQVGLLATQVAQGTAAARSFQATTTALARLSTNNGAQQTALAAASTRAAVAQAQQATAQAVQQATSQAQQAAQQATAQAQQVAQQATAQAQQAAAQTATAQAAVPVAWTPQNVRFFASASPGCGATEQSSFNYPQMVFVQLVMDSAPAGTTVDVIWAGGEKNYNHTDSQTVPQEVRPACIDGYSLDPSRFAIGPGTYQASLRINGTVLKTITITIVGPPPTPTSAIWQPHNLRFFASATQGCDATPQTTFQWPHVVFVQLAMDDAPAGTTVDVIWAGGFNNYNHTDTQAIANEVRPACVDGFSLDTSRARIGPGTYQVTLRLNGSVVRTIAVVVEGPAPTATPAPAPAAPTQPPVVAPTATSAAPPGPVQTWQVDILATRFSPRTLTINQGDSVIFSNTTIQTITITTDAGAPVGFSFILTKGNNHTITFNTPGVYSYGTAFGSIPHGTITVAGR